MQYNHIPDSDRDTHPSQSRVRSLPPPQQLPGSPLHWWRARRPQSFSRSDVKAIRAHLLRTETVNDIDWMQAVTGDPATAIGIAVRQMQAYGMTCPLVDAALSAVLCCAIEGDSAARAVVESALRRRRKIDPICAELILAWRSVRV